MVSFAARRAMMDENNGMGMTTMAVDYEDELAGIMQQHHGPVGGISGSDEDTEDASEFGEDEYQHEESQQVTTDIKETVYHDKLAYLNSLLADLSAGRHPEYVKKMAKNEKAYRYRVKLNEAKKDCETDSIERQFLREKKAAVREFEDKKIELKDTVIAEWEEKRKQIELDRYSVELAQDNTEVKSASTRKLRRRPNDPVPIPEKRRKTPQSQITFLLDDREIDADRDAITKIRVMAPNVSSKKSGSASSGNSNSSPPPEECSSSGTRMKSVSPPPPSSDIRIEDGKLFYEKRWFHRGQPVYVEGREIIRVNGNIGAISHDTVWIRKVGDPSVKLKVQLKQLINGKLSIKRRA